MANPHKTKLPISIFTADFTDDSNSISLSHMFGGRRPYLCLHVIPTMSADGTASQQHVTATVEHIWPNE
ncbi:hypothetical protein GCK32_021448 [Trichostrongylus colubriformis]|uniref:Uncharacterized protein n=1 Tax=Trichostrongylus colubriformis TaxID=6319 RepID=A0AAN8J1R9_TRICO